MHPSPEESVKLAAEYLETKWPDLANKIKSKIISRAHGMISAGKSPESACEESFVNLIRHQATAYDFLLDIGIPRDRIYNATNLFANIAISHLNQKQLSKTQSRAAAQKSEGEQSTITISIKKSTEEVEPGLFEAICQTAENYQTESSIEIKEIASKGYNNSHTIHR